MLFRFCITAFKHLEHCLKDICLPVVENLISVLGWEVKRNYPKGWSEALQVRYGCKLLRRKKKLITRKISMNKNSDVQNTFKKQTQKSN